MSRTPSGRAWLAARAPLWQALAETAIRVRRSGRVSIADAHQVLDGYRSLARDLATARQQLPGSRITTALEAVYASFHALVERAPRNTRAALLRMFRIEIPAVVGTLRGPILWVTLLFALSCGAGWWLIMTYPTLIGLIASEQMIDHVERGQLWTDGLLSVTPPSLLSIRIFSNNIVVSVTAFCAGIFYGLGTFYLIALNGLLLGGAFAFTHQHGLDGALFSFVIAHGTVELSIICLSGAAGMALGESLVRPTHGGRLASFQHCTARLSKLLLPCALLLVGCGLIEGYVSPNPVFPLASRVTIGICYWLVMLAVLTGRIFGARAGA
jgi:uncharacterized membrane protein SpoIIM required for sporulation